MNQTILVVDDEPRTRQGIQRTLELWSAGRFRVECVGSAVEAQEWLSRDSAQLLITDVRMPEVSGLDLIESLKDKPQKPVAIVISGYAEFDYVQAALRLGAFNYLLKPIDKEELVEVVTKALKMEEERQRHEKMVKLVDPKLLAIEEPEVRVGEAVRIAAEYVDDHLAEPLTLGDLAERLHMNSSYLSVLFKEQMGLPFTEYLTRKRMQRAKELLVQTRLPVCEIAEQVGYRTDKYFIKVFKQMECISPSRFRQGMTKETGPIS